MLNPTSHALHIYNHVQELLRLYTVDRVDRVLCECGLEMRQDGVFRRDGHTITGVDCQAYLKSVRCFISYVDFVLARISLVQAGCRMYRDFRHES